MAVATQGSTGNYLQRGSNPSGLADVLNILLDKGLVVDIYLRVSLVGIELLTVDARIVVASVDTYLRFAEAVNRMDLTQVGNSQTLPEFFDDLNENTAKDRTKGVLEGAKDKIFGDDDDDDDSKSSGRSSGSGTRSRSRSASSSGSRSRSSSGGSRSRAKKS
ncbi:MAG: gas vesicle structural protein [bacterium]